MRRQRKAETNGSDESRSMTTPLGVGYSVLVVAGYAAVDFALIVEVDEHHELLPARRRHKIRRIELNTAYKSMHLNSFIIFCFRLRFRNDINNICNGMM